VLSISRGERISTVVLTQGTGDTHSAAQQHLPGTALRQSLVTSLMSHHAGMTLQALEQQAAVVLGAPSGHPPPLSMCAACLDPAHTHVSAPLCSFLFACVVHVAGPPPASQLLTLLCP
jgi:hypothetical protein